MNKHKAASVSILVFLALVFLALSYVAGGWSYVLGTVLSVAFWATVFGLGVFALNLWDKGKAKGLTSSRSTR